MFFPASLLSVCELGSHCGPSLHLSSPGSEPHRELQKNQRTWSRSEPAPDNNKDRGPCHVTPGPDHHRALTTTGPGARRALLIGQPEEASHPGYCPSVRWTGARQDVTSGRKLGQPPGPRGHPSPPWSHSQPLQMHGIRQTPGGSDPRPTSE
uniref:Uncharacterized protein n=1 Tax=Knipowitschia caucasica TaxID=637954 RepID=A0AAV2IZ44_KNICA